MNVKTIIGNMNRFNLISWLLLGLLPHLVCPEEVTIVDTRNATSDLGWPSSGLGWTELTSTDENDSDLRTFQVCRIRKPNQNNWLRTPYLKVGNAQRIYVEIRFTIRSCEGMLGIISCKETFNLYYLPSDVEDNARASHMNVQTYTKVDTIAADERFKPNTASVNTERRIISPVTTRGLYLAFQDTGACMTIMHVRVYYKTCAETTRGLAWFPVTNTGPEVSSLVDVSGVCVEHSEKMRHGPAPSLHCNGEGQWLVPTGNCQCKPGFQPNDGLTECNECPLGKFKPSAGNGDCVSCPGNSFSVQYGATTCRCASGYYRSAEDRANVACTRPPGKPTSAEYDVNKTSVTLTWREPRDNGGREDITYSISCEKCDSSYFICSSCGRGVDFIPRRSRITVEKVVIRDLSPHTNYKFKIYSFNGVSDVSTDRPQFTELLVKTNRAAPPRVSSVRIVSTSTRGGLIEWDVPSDSPSPITGYQINYSSGSGVHSNSTKATSFKLHKLTPFTSYIVKVRAQSSAGYGLYSEPIAFRTKPDKATSAPVSLDDAASPIEPTQDNDKALDGATITHPSSGSQHLLIAIIVACVLLVISVGALFTMCGRRRQFFTAKSTDLEKYPGFINNSVDFVSSRTYVDPSTYEDPYIAVLEFAKEIDYNLVHIEQVIGSGEFGEVCKGFLSPNNRSVAIKTLKVGYNNQEKLDFLGEASIMGQFEHPNVIRLEGVVTKSRPLMIITEYMENGSLDSFLRENQNKLSTAQLNQILLSISCGMRYLSDMGYVHRDLAARNVLVNSGLECKVSDFGLSRFLEEVAEEEVAMYTTRGGMIPIRWTAPEAITKRTFSSSSDVWSYGIVMWEVLSFGERPYWEMTNQDVVHFVETGYRLPPPCFCPRVYHKMMLECWNCDLTKRPTFIQLVAVLSRFLQNDSCLQETVNNRSFREQEDCIPELLDLSSLGQWLEQVHLLHYRPLMLRHGCVTAEQIMRLTPSDLEQMGITSANDVNTLLREADVLRQKIEEVNNMGVAV